MNKRSFFKTVIGTIAAVAIAPEIAFGVRLQPPSKGWLKMRWPDGGVLCLSRLNDLHLSAVDFEHGLLVEKQFYEEIGGTPSSWSIGTS